MQYESLGEKCQIVQLFYVHGTYNFLSMNNYSYILTQD